MHSFPSLRSPHENHQAAPSPDKKHPSADPVAMRVEDLTEEDLAEMDASPIPEEARELNRLLPKGWPNKR